MSRWFWENIRFRRDMIINEIEFRQRATIEFIIVHRPRARSGGPAEPKFIWNDLEDHH